MSNYRDRIIEDFGHDAGQVVGSALDGLQARNLLPERFCYDDIKRLVEYYKTNKTRIDAMPLGKR